MPGQHSRFSPSAAERWLKCAACVPLSDGVGDTESEYAAEGTAAHELIESSLRLACEPSALMGCTFYERFQADADMVEAATVFTTFVRELAASHVGAEWYSEQRYEKDSHFGGTIDFHLRIPGQLLHIVDYKHGRGHVVEVKDNPQLLSYALLAWRGEPKIRITIVQPRAEHPDGPVRTIELIGADIIAHDNAVRIARELSQTAARDLLGIDPSNWGQFPAHFTVNDGCRWCPVLSRCPAQFELAQQAAMNDFQLVPDSNTPHDIERVAWLVLNKGKLIKLLEAAEQIAEDELNQRHEVPGLKLVEAVGRTKWVPDDDELLKKLRNKGFKKSDCTKTTPLSFNQMKKLEGMDVDWLSQFTVRPVTGLKVVPESDKRPAFIPSDPEAEFAHITDDGVSTNEPAGTD